MNEQLQQRKLRFISLRLKFLICFTILFSAVFTGTFYWFYRFSTDKAAIRIQEDMVNTLIGAAKGINGDEFEALAREGKTRADGLTNDPRYWRLINWLVQVHTIESRGNLYTFIKGKKSPYEVLWIGDQFVVTRPKDASKFREAYINKNSKIYLGLKKLTLSMTPYTDKWGYWVSAYRPITNSRNEIVGGIGLDFRANYLIEVQQSIGNSILIAFIITYFPLFILVYIISKILTRPIITLTKVAEQIGEGNYQENLSFLNPKQFKDEINLLAEVFEIMMSKVRTRENSLKQQVVELKIEIDQVKREQEVKEIVETDFFKNLQAKVLKLRSQNSIKPDSDPLSKL